MSEATLHPPGPEAPPASWVTQNLKHNFLVNVIDGSFFGFAIGFASFITILPLFVSTMTDSALLIGLIPAIHNAGWQLPQLFMAQRVARQPRFKPMVLALTVQERLPFLGLAGVAWWMGSVGQRWALLLTFLLITWQGLGAGLTANGWQSMIAKIIPPDRRGSFIGVQASAANVLASISAVAAGFLLEKLPSPLDFTLCFLLATVFMGVSWYFLALTREPATPPPEKSPDAPGFWNALRQILRRDRNFRWYLLARIVLQFGTIGFAFYTVYAVRFHHVGEGEVGIMTGVLLATQILANPIMGWLGDRWNRRKLSEIGMLAAAGSGLLAWLAPNPAWFYLVFILCGIANVSIWTVGMAMTMEFGQESERPMYIGLANTLTAPANILAPLLGGWMANLAGYPAAFQISVVGALCSVAIFHWLVTDPRRPAAGSPVEASQ